MTKVVTASEAKNRLGTVLEWAASNQGEVVIERRGRPSVVMVAFDQYQKWKQLEEQQRRQEALAQLEAIARDIRAKNQDLTAADADALADDIMSETIGRMAAEGKIRFKQP